MLCKRNVEIEGEREQRELLLIAHFSRLVNIQTILLLKKALSHDLQYFANIIYTAFLCLLDRVSKFEVFPSSGYKQGINTFVENDTKFLFQYQTYYAWNIYTYTISKGENILNRTHMMMTKGSSCAAALSQNLLLLLKL